MALSTRFQALKERLQKTVGHAVSTAKLDFADQFDALLEANHLSRAELAEKIGKSRPFVSRVLRGDANPTLQTMVELVFHAGGTFRFEISPATAQGAQAAVAQPTTVITTYVMPASLSMRASGATPTYPVRGMTLQGASNDVHYATAG